MIPASIVRRYASALFDVAQAHGQVERVARDLSAFRALVDGHPELPRIFENPSVPPARKLALVEALVRASGDLSPEVGRLLRVLADNDRLTALGAIDDAFAARLREAQHIVPAEVTTAVPLTDSRRAALAAALGKATGGQVLLSERVDPEIIGGVIARVGSLVFDGSVTRQVARMRQRLLERQ